MLPLNSLIDQITSRRRWPISSQAVHLLRHYPEIVGPGLSKHTSIKWIKNGTACIHCRNSMWSYALRAMEQELVVKMNAFIGKELIEKLLIRIGNVREQKVKEKDPILSKEDLLWIDNLSEQVPTDIREKFASFLTAFKGKQI
jgi:predicted nucleic acid-binding Zn ribbon protein